MKKIDYLTEKLKEELKKSKMLLEDDDLTDLDDEDDSDDNNDESEEDDEDDTIESSETGSNDDFCELSCKILHSRNQAHVFHLGVTGEGSFNAL